MKYPITPDVISDLPDKLAGLYIDLEAYVINDICSRLKLSGTATNTAIEQIRQLLFRGYDAKAIGSYIKRFLRLSDAEFNAMWEDAVERNQRYFNSVISKDTLLDRGFDSLAFEKEIQAICAQTQGALQNITQSMGFAIYTPQGLQFMPIAQTYQHILDGAMMKIQSGTTGVQQAIREATAQLTNSGLQTIDYASGWHNRVDVAARRACMTGISQMSAKYSEQECNLLDTPYREVSAHVGARDINKPNPWSNHKAWQGKVYSLNSGDKYPSIYAVCGLGQVDGLTGVNCRHMYFPFVEGVSERTYTDEQLKNIDPPPFTYQGREYTAYQATQKQRQIETAIRKTKRDLIASNASGDKELYTAQAVKLQRLKDEYKTFSDAAGLPMQRERANIAEFGSKQSQQAAKAAKSA